MNFSAFTVRSSVLAAAVALVLSGTITHAQTIERMLMTDNDLTCQQIYNETVQMDAVIARASQTVAAVALVAPGADPNANVGAQVAGAVAQQQALVQQQAAVQAQQGAMLAQQAQGRKEHLTTMFLSKGFKLGDMQR